MLTLYHLTNSRSQRIIWLLEALQCDYELVFCERNIKGLAPDWLKTIHPTGKVPILTIEENGQKTVLAETSAIFDFLSFKFAKHKLFNTQPLTSQQLEQYCYYKNFADSSLMPNLALKQIFVRIVNRSPFFGKLITSRIKQVFDKEFLNPLIYEQLDMIETTLQQQQFLSGETLMSVDILMEFMLAALKVSMPQFENYHNIERYLQELHTQQSYQTAITKGQFNKAEFSRYWQTAW